MIHRFRVRNFKSIIDVSVDLAPVTVLVGQSGTGKSNFVHSIRFLRDLLSSPNPKANHFQQSLRPISPATAPKTFPEFEIDFTISGIKEIFKYQLRLGPTQSGVGPQLERLDLGERCIFHQVAVLNPAKSVHSKWTVAPDLVQVPNAGTIALGRIPSISEVVIAFTALTSGIGCYSFADDVLSISQKNVTQQLPSGLGLDDSASNFLVTLKEIASNLQDLSVRKSILGALQRVNPSVSAVELNDLMQPSHIVVAHKFDGKTLSLTLSQESDGFRRFYAQLMALYQRPPKQTLIFEHPEDGIHPGALSILAEEFKAASRNGRGQVILTTHSPKLLDYFDADEIRVVELDGFATRVGKVSEEQAEAIRERLLDAGELLTVDPARIQPETASP